MASRAVPSVAELLPIVVVPDPILRLGGAVEIAAPLASTAVSSVVKMQPIAVVLPPILRQGAPVYIVVATGITMLPAADLLVLFAIMLPRWASPMVPILPGAATTTSSLFSAIKGVVSAPAVVAALADPPTFNSTPFSFPLFQQTAVAIATMVPIEIMISAIETPPSFRLAVPLWLPLRVDPGVLLLGAASAFPPAASGRVDLISTVAAMFAVVARPTLDRASTSPAAAATPTPPTVSTGSSATPFVETVAATAAASTSRSVPPLLPSTSAVAAAASVVVVILVPLPLELRQSRAERERGGRIDEKDPLPWPLPRPVGTTSVRPNQIRATLGVRLVFAVAPRSSGSVAIVVDMVDLVPPGRVAILVLALSLPRRRRTILPPVEPVRFRGDAVEVLSGAFEFIVVVSVVSDQGPPPCDYFVAVSFHNIARAGSCRSWM